MINVELHQSDFLPHQWDFITDWSRTLGLVGGLGSGKTIAFIAKAMVCLLTRPGANGLANIGIGYPTYDMGRSLFFYPFCEHLNDMGIPYDANKSRLEITTDQGSIVIRSLNDPEKIIGDTFTDAGVDEIDTLPMPKGLRAINRLRERLRGRKDSQLFLVSSPEGFSTCYETLVKNPNTGTIMIKAKTTDNFHLSDGYIDNIRQSYDPQMVLAYLNGEFVNLNGLAAHYAFSREHHVAQVEPPPPELPLQIGVDFNVDPMTACVGYWDWDVLKFFDEYYLRHSNTYQLADLIAEDYPGRVIETYPDPTGVARKSSADASDIQILQRKGFSAKWINGVTQRESLNLANGEFSHNRVVIDPKCENLIHDLEQVVTDSHGQILKPKDTLLTHISDAMRNIIVYKKKQPGRWSAY